MTKRMGRRDFLGLGFAAAWTFAATNLAVVTIQSLTKADSLMPTFNKAHTFGYVSAEMPGSHNLKVYLDGEDVAAQCNEANDREGWVNLLMVDKDGNASAPLKFKCIYGHVVIKRHQE